MAELPPHANLEWLRKTARQAHRRRKQSDPAARLADAQRDLARDYGFSSWRALKRHVENAAATLADTVATAFMRAVGDGDMDRVRAALAAMPALVNIVGPHPYWGGRPQPLHVAIETKRLDMFDLLLAAGADVDGRNDAYDHWSPVMLTFSRDRPDMREELVARGAHIGLAEALMMGDDDRAAALLAAGLPPVPNGGSILAFARTPWAIDRLLELGANPTRKDRWGVTPIEALSRLGPKGRELVRHLMLRGVAPAPEQFARLGDQAGLAILAEADPAVARADAVMIAAVDSGSRDLVRWLLEKGASANAQAGAPTYHSALHAAAWNGDLNMAKLLVAAGADLAVRDKAHDSVPRGWAETAATITNNPRCEEVANWLAGRESGAS